MGKRLGDTPRNELYKEILELKSRLNYTEDILHNREKEFVVLKDIINDRFGDNIINGVS